MAKTETHIDLKGDEKKSLGWSAVLTGCIPSSKSISSSSAKEKLKNQHAASSDEDELVEENGWEDHVIEKITESIDSFLTEAKSEDAWSEKLGSIASTMVVSSGLIKSMTTGSKTVLEKLTSTKFEDISKTAEDICGVLGKAHWATSGLLVVAAVIHNINKQKHVDRACLELLGSVTKVGKTLSKFSHLRQIPDEMRATVNETRTVIAESAACCLSIIHYGRFRKFFFTSKNEEQIASCRKKLSGLQRDLSFQLIFADYVERHEPKAPSSGITSRKKKKRGDSAPVDQGIQAGDGSSKTEPDQEPETGFQKCIGNFTYIYKHTIGVLTCHPDHQRGKESETDASQGTEDAVSTIKKRLDLNTHSRGVVVFICGARQTGKSELAKKVIKDIEGELRKGRWKLVDVKTPEPARTEGGPASDLAIITELRSEILKQLEGELKESQEDEKRGDESLQLIENDREWQKRLSVAFRKTKKVFLFIDDVPTAEVLKKVLPTEIEEDNRIRVLLTIYDSSVISAMEYISAYDKKRPYVMKPLSYNEALDVFSKKKEQLPDGFLNKDAVSKIIKICKGYKKRIKTVRDYLVKYYMEEEDFTRLFEWIRVKEPEFRDLQYYLTCEETFLHQSFIIRDALLDLCSFYSDWEWDEAACVLDNDVLQKLKQLELVRRESNRVSVPDHVMSFCLSRAKESRITNANDLHTAIQERKFHKVKGIWLLQNKFPFLVSSKELDQMDALRVLALGDWSIVKGKCEKNFSHLSYYQAGSVGNLPIDNINQLDNLRLLDNSSNQFIFVDKNKVPPTLKMVKSKGLKFQDHKELKLLPDGCQLADLDISGSEIKEFPISLCELYGLQKIILSKSLQLMSLPKSFYKLRSLKMLDLSHCASLINLPSNFGWLSSLEKVNFSYCRRLKELPESMGLLNSVKDINLSYCKTIEKLPPSIMKLSTLRILKLRACTHLVELPQGFEGLALKELDLEACKRLKALPEIVGDQKLLLKTVSLSWSLSIAELTKGFISLIKLDVEHLNLVDCIGLETLPDEFTTELCRLKNLNLSGCRSLLRLPKRFHKLQSLEKLNLSSCEKLEESSIKLSRLPALREVNLSKCKELKGDCLTNLIKLERLAFLNIHDSPNLVDRWNHMNRENKICHFKAATDTHAWGSRSFSRSLSSESRISKELKRGTFEFFHNKWYFVDSNGKPLYPSTLEAGTTLAVIFDHDYDKQEFRGLSRALDDLQNTSEYLQIVHLGRFVCAFAKELGGRHRVYTSDNYEGHVFFQKALSTVESYAEKEKYAIITCNVEINTDKQKEDEKEGKVKEKKFSQWQGITYTRLRAVAVDVSKDDYLGLKELIDAPTSDMKLLRELLLTKEINFLITSTSQMKIEDLQGKVVFLLISWLHKFEQEKHQFEAVYKRVRELHRSRPQEKPDFEVVWIPIVIHGKGTRAQQVEAIEGMLWPAVADPWAINPVAMHLFRMHPNFNELPLLIAVKPDGELFYDNLASKNEEQLSQFVIECPVSSAT